MRRALIFAILLLAASSSSAHTPATVSRVTTDPTGLPCTVQSPLLLYTTTQSVATFGCSSGSYVNLGARFARNTAVNWYQSGGSSLARWNLGTFTAQNVWHPSGDLNEQWTTCFNCSPVLLGSRHDSGKWFANLKFEAGWNEISGGSAVCEHIGQDCSELFEWNGNYANAAGTGAIAGGNWRWLDFFIQTNFNGMHDGATPSSTVLTDSSRTGVTAFNAHSQRLTTCTDTLQKIVNVTDGESCDVTACSANTVTCSGGLSGGATFDEGDFYEVIRYPRGEWNLWAYDGYFDPPNGGPHLAISQTTGAVTMGRGFRVSGESDDEDAGDSVSFPAGWSVFNAAWRFNGNWTGKQVNGINALIYPPAGQDHDVNRIQAGSFVLNLGSATTTGRDITNARAGFFDLNFGSANNQTITTAYAIEATMGGTVGAAQALTVTGGLVVQTPPSSLVGRTAVHAGVRIEDQRAAGSGTSDAIAIAGQTASASKGNIRFIGGKWNTGHVQLSNLHLWDDGAGDFRAKNGAPSSATDGTEIIKRTDCETVPDVAAALEYEVFIFGDAATVLEVACHCRGTCSTPAVMKWQDRAGNDIASSSATCGSGTGNTTWTDNTDTAFVRGEGLRIKVTNTPAPTTDRYTVCWRWR